MRCAYSYRHNNLKECPYEVAEDLVFYPFHDPTGEKDFEGADLSGEDLEEAYLSGANLKRTT